MRDLLLAAFGGYPDPREIHRDYEGFIQANLLPFVYTARKDQPIPPSLLTKETPSSLTDQGLIWDRVPGIHKIASHRNVFWMSKRIPYGWLWCSGLLHTVAQRARCEPFARTPSPRMPNAEVL